MSFIMISLFNAVILEGFKREILDEQSISTKETINKFQKLWKKYDPDATGMIRIEDI